MKHYQIAYMNPNNIMLHYYVDAKDEKEAMAKMREAVKGEFLGIMVIHNGS